MLILLWLQLTNGTHASVSETTDTTDDELWPGTIAIIPESHRIPAIMHAIFVRISVARVIKCPVGVTS